VSRTRPLLLAIDDCDRADEFSRALLASIAHRAASAAMVSVVTQPVHDATVAAGDVLGAGAPRIRLQNLNFCTVSARTPYCTKGPTRECAYPIRRWPIFARR
jgi:predicted ATPase